MLAGRFYFGPGQRDVSRAQHRLRLFRKGFRRDWDNSSVDTQYSAAGFDRFPLARLPMTTLFRCWAEIDIEAMRSNLRAIRSLVAAGVRIIAVVKADAFVHSLSGLVRAVDG